MQSPECVLRRAFGEDIAQLILGVDLDQGDAVLRVGHVRSKPVIFDGVVL